MHSNRLVYDLGNGEQDLGLDDWTHVHVFASVCADLLLPQHLFPQLLLPDRQYDFQELRITYLNRARRLELESEELVPVTVLLGQQLVARLGIVDLQEFFEAGYLQDLLVLRGPIISQQRLVNRERLKVLHLCQHLSAVLHFLFALQYLVQELSN